jgi:hypothetical protein
MLQDIINKMKRHKLHRVRKGRGSAREVYRLGHAKPTRVKLTTK